MITLVAALLLAAAPAEGTKPAEGAKTAEGSKTPAKSAAPTKLSSTKWVAVKAKIRETASMQWAVRHHQGQDAMDDNDAKLNPRLSPPVPAVWPPTGKGGYFVYLYAAGPRPSLHDGEEVTAPWARATIDGSNQRVDDFGPLKRLGMQGVRPIGAPQKEIIATQEAAEQAVVTLTRAAAATPAAVAPLVQRYYCQWAMDNGIIAFEVQRLHPAFWKWLSCS